MSQEDVGGVRLSRQMGPAELELKPWFLLGGPSPDVQLMLDRPRPISANLHPAVVRGFKPAVELVRA